MSTLKSPKVEHAFRGGFERPTLIDLLRRRAFAQPGGTAYTFLRDGQAEEESLTYGELERRALSIAARLQEAGMRGQRVLLLYPPGLEYVAAFWGCIYAGAVAVPAYPPRPNRGLLRLRAIVADAQAGAALTDASILSRLEPILAQTEDLRALRWVATGGVEPDELAERWSEPEVDADTLAFLQYTSGSTAAPKGVMVSHGNLLHNEEMIRRVFRQTEQSVIVGWLPLYHDMGLIGNVLQPMYVGARCILLSPTAFLQKPYRWLEAVSRYRATTSGGPNFAYDLCVDRISAEERATLDLSSWTTAFNGAEPIRAETLERFADAFGACGFRPESFHPCYGLAEATLLVSGSLETRTPAVRAVGAKALEHNRAEQSAPGLEEVRLLVGCGNALPGQRIVAVDPESRVECLPGEVGEIMVSGPSVARGYWNQPEATEEIFRARVAGFGDEQFLRTGDLGFIEDGELFITGRLKDLIIIRGRNHYPQDIERTAELSHVALRRGCGAAFRFEVSGEERLVLVQEVNQRQTFDADEVVGKIRAAIADEHEIAVHAVVLIKASTIPKTSSGKIRRGACREEFAAGLLNVVAEWREGGAREASAATLPLPRGADEVEGWLRAQVASAVGRSADEIDAAQPIASYGLDSLAAVSLAHRIESGLGAELSFTNLLQDNSTADLAALLRGRLEAPPPAAELSSDAAADAPRDAPAGHALTHGQQSLWFLHQMAPESTAYHIVNAVRIVSELDARALRRAMQALVERHPALRTTFAAPDGKPVQHIHERAEVCFEEEVAEGLSESEFDARLLRDAHRPFDLERGPLLRVSLYRRAAREHVLLLALHHIVADFWSLAVLMRELGVLYSAALDGSTPALAPLGSQYTDFARWQSELLAGAEGERHWSYWREQLAGDPPPLNLPLDHVRPSSQTFRGASHPFKLDAELTARIRDLSRARGATLYMTLLAAFQALLQRYTGQTDISVGTATSGRARASWSDLVGYFVNPVVMRADLSGDPTFASLLERTRETALAAFEHQDYPFPLLVARLQPTRDPSRSPLFQVMFVLQKAQLPGAGALASFALGEAGARIDLGDLSLESRPLEQRIAQFDLTLALTETDDGLAASLEYNTSLFEPETAERLAAHYARLLESAASEPGRRVSELEMLCAEERSRLLDGWGGPASRAARTADGGATLRQLFEEQVRRAPDAVAVSDGNVRVSYAELNARANRLARLLRRRGVGAESRVGLLAGRSAGLAVGALAALKAGAAYVPLDPEQPAWRLGQMARDAGARILITRADLSAAASAYDGEVLYVDDGGECAEAASEDAEDLGVEVSGENLAYVIYTSGSTGLPKGVAVERASLTNLVRWHQETYDVQPGDRATLIAGPGFDASVWELWPYLTAGASLHIPDEETRTSAPKLVGWLAAEAINVCFLPTPLAEAVLEVEWPADSSLRLLLTGGDKLRRWLHKPFPFRLINHYGPTENTVVATAAEVGAAAGASALPPIGHPIDNTRVYLLSPHLQPVPVGVNGELYIGGDGVARGYLGRPDLTAERFVPDPFSPEPGARMYRTGDISRRLPGGEFEYLGRGDQQVKVRGFRVELGEIEAVLGRHESVRECVVVAVERLNGETRLAAYVTAQPGGGAPAAKLRDFLAEKLPEYMLPYAFVTLDALPLTPNGKVDMRALPAPSADESGDNYVAPRTPTEEVLTGIWSALLGLRRASINDNFFESGGHSLLAAQLVSRVRAAFNVELPLRSVFESPTPARLAAHIEAAAREARGLLTPPIRRVARDGEIPLSFSQQRLWFLSQFESDSPHYNIAAALRLHGRLDDAALEGSLDELVRRHESLRTVFVLEGEDPRQEIVEDLKLPLPSVSLEELAEGEREAEARRLAAAEARGLFDLEHGPLVRARLLRLGEEEHVLLLTMHHIVSDGWSMGVLIKELSILYNSFARGAASPLAELPVQYADFAHWQRRWLKGEALEGLVQYWRRQLSGSPPALELPTDYARPEVQTFRGARLPLTLDGNLTASLRALSRESDATLFMTLLAGFQALLWRYTGQREVSVGTPVAGRTRRESEPLVGFFVNTLVLRAEVGGGLTFRELVGRAREACLGAYQHQELPFERLVEELRPEREGGRTPLFQVMLVLQNMPLPAVELDGVRAEAVEVTTGTAKFELTLALREEADGTLSGSIDYQTDLFSRETVERLAHHFVRLLESAVSEPGRRLSELEMLGEGERRRLLVEWNQTRRDYPAACLHELFEQQVARTPESVALVCGDERVTYAALDARAERLARRLRGLGVGPETAVGVLMERSVELVVALLGILKAGGAYVPLDPSYPQERVTFMSEDARVRVLLTQSRLRAALADVRAAVICLDEAGGADASDAVPAGVAARAATPDNLAYVIYTSGSTGRPKGVGVTHRAICNHLLWRQRVYPLTAEDRFLHKASISFDISVWEMCAPLIAGAQLVLARPRGQQDSQYLVRLMSDSAVTVAHFGPPMLSTVLREPEVGGCRSLRHVFCGGESLTEDLRQRFFETMPDGVSLHHQYGPTETTVDVTAWDCERDGEGDAHKAVTIGRAIDNVSLYVLDAGLRPVPQGVAGELHVGGVALARGYLNRPALTAERFVPDPFSPEPGARMYRTGDLARHLHDGRVEFLGRADEQVKVRGFRIEPGEIESALRAYRGVRDCVVAARGDGGDKRLTAYLVADADHALDVAAVRGYLKKRLPEFMLPQSYVTLPAIPLSPSGKVDRRALPAPEQSRPRLEKAFVAPRDEVEQLVANAWAEVLGLDEVGVEDNFFDLGGHSLMATRVYARLRGMFGDDIPLRAIFEKPTVAELAAYVQTVGRPAGEQAVPPITPVPRDGPLPLSFAQQRLWFLDKLEAGRAAYNIPTAVRLSGALDVDALRRSLDEVLRRHEALRTAFVTADGQPSQLITPPTPLPLLIDDLSGLPDDERPEAARRLAARESAQTFDLAVPPLVRARLLRLGAGEHLLVVVFHHIVSDGWSLGVFVREVCALYDAFSRGEASPLPELAVQYADFAVWQRARLRGDALAAEVDYWRGKLGGVSEPLALPTDRPRPVAPRFDGATHSFLLPPPLTARLKDFSRGADATLFMTLLAGFQALLWRYTGQGEVSVGTPVAGRTRRESEPLVGFFVNTLVLRTDTSGDPSFVQLVGRAREACLGAYQHQELPFERLVEELRPEREGGRTPLFQVMLVLQNMPLPDVKMNGVRSQGVLVDSGMSKFELTLYLRETAEGLTGIIEYRKELFDAETIERLAEHFMNLLESAASEPGRRLSELEMLGRDERRRLLSGWGDAAPRRVPSPAARHGSTIHELFEEQVRRAPGAVALSGRGGPLTYTELNGRANRLARLLRRLGVGAESRVGLLAGRSAGLAVGALAALKAGAAYVPLDPSLPPGRLAHMIADAGAGVLLAGPEALDAAGEQDIAERLGAREVISVGADGRCEAAEAESDEDLGVEVWSENLAYVIYTSGSTGLPKGVLGLHGGALNRFRWMWETYPFTTGEVCCQKTSMSFVDFVWELFGPLLQGVPTFIIPDEVVRDTRRFVEALAAAGVTRLVLVPSLLAAMLEACDELGGRLPKLKQWVVSGEALPPALARRFRRDMPDRTLLNLYGSSEVSADVTCCEVNTQDAAAAHSIGRPIADTRIYLLDAHLQPVPRVAWGELYAAGAGLARGYLGRPDLTAERFVPDPFSPEPGARMYRTGDLARWLPDGQIELRGRVDQQLKVRGFRVEPGEVEAALVEHPHVAKALVMLREETTGDKRLVAYLNARGPEPPATSEELRRHLRARLPEYMIPSDFLTLDSFPLTPSGKVDRQALLAAKAAPAVTASAYTAPQTEVERAVVSIMQEVLGVERVGINDNFFDLGGHSLLLVKLQSRLEAEFKREVSLVELFEYPTAGSLTRYFSDGREERSSVREIQERLERQKEALGRRKRRAREEREGGR